MSSLLNSKTRTEKIIHRIFHEIEERTSMEADRVAEIIELYEGLMLKYGLHKITTQSEDGPPKLWQAVWHKAKLFVSPNTEKRIPTCSHGVKMNEYCGQCAGAMRLHMNAWEEKPRRG